MKSLRRYAEPIVLTIAAALVLISNPHDNMRHWMTLSGATEFWLDRAGLLARLSTLNAGIAIVLAIAGSWRIRRGMSSLTGWLPGAAREAGLFLKTDVAAELRRSFFSPGGIIAFAGILIIGISVRIYFLGQPMRYDEALTYMKFVRFDFWDMFFYPFPNNHVLHTVLVKISTLIFGGNPLGIRLPAALFGIVTFALFVCLCRMWNEGSSGILGGITFGIMPFVVLYSTMGRGYTMLMWIVLAMLIVGRRAAERPGAGAALILGLLGGAGLWTMPSMLFALAGIYLWILLLALKSRVGIRDWIITFVLPMVLVTAFLTYIAYLPVVIVNLGTETLLANKNVVAQPWDVFLSEIGPHVREIRSYLRRDIPFAVQITTLALMGAGYWRVCRRRDFGLITLAPAMFAGGMAVFFWKHKIPFPRTWIYLIPVCLLYADAGYTWVAGMLPRRLGFAAGLAACVWGAFFAGNLIAKNTLVRYPDTGALPDAEQLALKIISMMDEDDNVLAKAPADWPVYYYLHLHGSPDYRRLPKLNPNAKREFLVTRKNRYVLKDLTDRPATLIMDVPKGQLYVIEQTTPTVQAQ